MAYRFEPDESVREAFARCAREELDRAMRTMSEKLETEPADAVHAARKAIKRERALLRLMRGTIAADQCRRENAALRAAARGLSGARESEAMIQTLDRLSERFSGQPPANTFDVVRERLVLRRGDERVQLATSTVSSEALQDVRMRVDDWKLGRDGWRALDCGLLQTYRRGRKAFHRACQDRSSTNMHVWRKRVKDLWYQLRLLAPVGGPAVAGQAKDADRLADLLGADHDLAVLQQALIGVRAAVAVDTDPLLRLAGYRRKELQTEALHLGQRLYAERTNAFGRRMRRCWRAGRAEARASYERRPAELTRSLSAA